MDNSKAQSVGGGFGIVLAGCACYDPGCIPSPGKPCRNFRKGDKNIKAAQERAKRRMAKR